MNSENSKTSKPHILIFNLTLSNLSIYYTHGKTYKTHITIKNLKYLFQHGMMNLNYQMDEILYQIFKISLSIL